MRNLLALVLWLAVPLSGQTSTSGKAQTTGSCSPAVSGNRNQFKIYCNGISKQQAAEFIKLLNGILSRQLDPNLVYGKLDDIQKGIDEIRDRTAPRMISDEYAVQMVSNLAIYKGQKATLAYVTSDSESQKLCEQIFAILQAAGWDVSSPVGAIFGTSGPMPGVEVQVQKPTSAANSIRELLYRDGLSEAGDLRPQMPSDTINIIVYQKPIGN